MNILLSAYSCAPYWGSEPGVGWNYALQLGLQGHHVIVVTNDESKPYIEGYTGIKPANLIFVYHSLPKWIKRYVYRGVGPLAHIYNFMWQISLFFFLRKFIKDKEIDVIHHITLGVFRIPVYLGLLEKPFVLGPVGGGEASTRQLQEHLPFKYKIKEKLRHWANLSVLINPLNWITYETTNLILIKTQDNLRYIPRRYHHKCKVNLEVGIAENILERIPDIKKPDKNFKILYAGRLEYWKGIHLAIKAYAKVIERFPDTTFTIVGSGADEGWLRQIASEQNIVDKINWLPRVTQEELFRMYSQYDILLFPSLHDSSGGVVIEALAHGLPVVCLDLGGPKEIVDESCGCIIPTKNASEGEIIVRIAQTVNLIITQPERLISMRERALLKGRGFSWGQVVSRTYNLIERHVLKCIKL